MRCDESIDQDLGDLDQGLAVDAVLQPAEGRRRGQGPIGLGRPAGGQLGGGVAAERLMVVEVLVAQGDGRDPLGDHGVLVVDDECGISGVGDGGVEGIEEPEVVSDLAEQQGAGVGGEASAVEIGDDGLGSEAGKVKGIAVTVRHSGGLAVCGWGRVLTQSLQGVRPSRKSPAARRMKYPG